MKAMERRLERGGGIGVEKEGGMSELKRSEGRARGREKVS